MNNHRVTRLRWFVHDFVNLNLVGFSDGEWAAFRQELFLHLYRGERLTAQHEFHLIDNRSVGTAQAEVKAIVLAIAQENVRRMPDPRTYGSPARWRKDVALWRRHSARRLRHLVHFCNLRLPSLEFKIIRAPDGTLQKQPVLDWTDPDGATLIKAIFLEALTEVGTWANQIMMCENRSCGKLFVSTRKPRQDRNAHYCSVECCHIESRRRYLEDPINKKKERVRNRERYKLKKRKALGERVRVGRKSRH